MCFFDALRHALASGDFQALSRWCWRRLGSFAQWQHDCIVISWQTSARPATGA
ncbi:hypothetical protein APV28_4979 [Comamonas testosteroni]|nr:hypothetical protein APV28_4979 [Comamonas testosteroni]